MRKWIILVVPLFVLLFSAHALAAGNSPERIAGHDRFDVAGGLATKGWADGADTVVITNYLAFADALSAAPLAFKNNAPILLTNSDSLTDKTRNQLNQLKPSKVFVIGGEASITPNVVNEIKSISGVKDVERIGGHDRFAVAASIAAKLGTTNTAVLANGMVFSDALSIAPYAARNGYPILLTQSDSLPNETADAINNGNFNKTIVVGGTASVPDQILSNLPAPQRIDGHDRYEVAANIIRDLDLHVEGAFIATGQTFADALTGSVVAAKEGAPILLSASSELPQSTLDIIKEKDIQNFVILGGTGSISDAVVSNISNNIKATGPVVYLVPHGDDETLTYSIDIRNQMALGRPVYLVLFSQGEDSGARFILNGTLKCNLDGTYHNPIAEKYKDGILDKTEFGAAREDEYFRASKAMGVPEDHIFADIVPLDDLQYGNTQSVETVIEKYLAKFPDAEFRTMSWLDGHPQHATIGRALKIMEDRGEINPFKTLYFISVYTRQHNIPIPFGEIKEDIKNSSDQNFIKAAINEYDRWDPQNGFYAIGFHSVKSQFDDLMKDYSTYYYN